MEMVLSPEDAVIKTTCPYCGVGCGVDASRTGRDIVAVTGTADHPANAGRLCVKGSALHETAGLGGRLLHPRVGGTRVDWDTALDTVAAGFQAVIDRHGPDAVAFYLSGQLLTEDYYVANKLMKGFIGSANVDTNSRLCMSSAVAAHKRAFGADVVPGNYEDLETCDLLVMVGSNAAWTHPVLYQRIVAARERRPGLRVVVIDPRATATCDIADLHLAIHPGSDAFVFGGLLRYLACHGALNRRYLAAHTEGVDEALAAVEHHPIDTVAAIADIDPELLETFYRWFAETEKVVTFYSQGINQSATGTDKCNAIINCHLATGRLGRPGMGPFSVTGQPNAMGGREVGGLANQLAAHMDFTPDNVERVGRFWRAPRMATRPGLKAVELFDAIERGEIKAVWIMATNPVVSLPDADRVRGALARCELVVVSDCMENTDTTALAHVLLPAAGWGEKDGTVTNSERRISRQRALRPAAGEARDDWWIISHVARRMGFGAGFGYGAAADVFREHAALSGFENHGTRAFDIGALAELSAAQYHNLAPIQWPVTRANPQGTERLFDDGRFFTATGRARMVAVKAALPGQSLCGRFPFVLNTGRVRDQWHSMTRTAQAPRLLSHVDAPFVSVHPADAGALGLAAGDLAELRSAQGWVRLDVRPDEGLRPGTLFAPIHWNDQFAAAARVGALIAPLADPHSGQPESKFTPVALRRLAVSRWLYLVSREDIDPGAFDHWVRIPITGGYRYQLALLAGNDLDPQAWWRRLARGRATIDFEAGAGAWRALANDGSRLDMAIFAAPERAQLPEPSWLNGLLDRVLPSPPWLALAGRDGQGEDRGRPVCACFDVGDRQIARALDAGADSVKALGAALRCGTNCGSCIPELKTLIRNHARQQSCGRHNHAA